MICYKGLITVFGGRGGGAKRSPISPNKLVYLLFSQAKAEYQANGKKAKVVAPPPPPPVHKPHVDEEEDDDDDEEEDEDESD